MNKKKTLSPIRWNDETQSVILLDQRMLPYTYQEVEIKSYEEMATAIRDMVLRGAPLIGIAAAYGMVLAGKEEADFRRADEVLRATRPTAVNLMWALDEMQTLLQESKTRAKDYIYPKLLEKAKWIHQDDIDRCKKMSEVGAEYIKKKFFNKVDDKYVKIVSDSQGLRSENELKFTQVNEASSNEHNAVNRPQGLRIMTHCNAGALATGGYGTALGVIRKLHEEGLVEMVYSNETRPRQQGSRLTVWELAYEGIPVTMVSDGMAGHCMKKGMIDLVIVGSDRITANGDVANKIGTYQVAIVANHHKVPFFVAAPESTIDRTLAHGDMIPIEERDASELHTVNRELVTANEGVSYFNPGFDVTPNELVEAIFTEKGVFSE